MEVQPVPIHKKYGLSISETAELFGIGEKVIRRILRNNPDAGLAINNGVTLVVRRKKFKKFLNATDSL